MKKNKGIWIVIVMIILVGIGVTFFTSRFVKNTSKTESATATEAAGNAGQVPEDTAEDSGGTMKTAPQAAMGAPVPEMRSAAPDFQKETAAAADQGSTEALNGEAGVAVMAEAGAGGVPVYDGTDGNVSPNAEASEEVLSPLAPSNNKMALVQVEKQQDVKGYYEKHLAELDSQIQKMREESTDSTTYSMQALAEKELKMWNVELSSVYSAIMNALEEDAKAALEQSQQVWMKARDSKAQEAAKKYAGGTLEGVEYTATLTQSTRQRTYDLVDEYISVLSSDE